MRCYYPEEAQAGDPFLMFILAAVWEGWMYSQHLPTLTTPVDMMSHSLGLGKLRDPPALLHSRMTQSLSSSQQRRPGPCGLLAPGHSIHQVLGRARSAPAPGHPGSPFLMLQGATHPLIPSRLVSELDRPRQDLV